MRRGKRCCIVDSNLFLAYDKGNTTQYPRVTVMMVYLLTQENTVIQKAVYVDPYVGKD